MQFGRYGPPWMIDTLNKLTPETVRQLRESH